MDYTKDYGKVGLTFAHYQQGVAVEELTLVPYEGELYVSLRGTVMNENIPTEPDDWFKVSTFGDLLEAIQQVKADSEQLKLDITAIKNEAVALLQSLQQEIEAELQSIETRATTLMSNLTLSAQEVISNVETRSAAAISDINATNNRVAAAEALRVEAENLRASVEQARANAESARLAAESLREENEEARNASEAERASDFAEITESWAHMQTAIQTTIQTAADAAARAVEAAQSVDEAIQAATEAAEYATTEGGKIQPALDAMDEIFEEKEAERDAAVEMAANTVLAIEMVDGALNVTTGAGSAIDFDESEITETGNIVLTYNYE